jgi:hypothetical protein
MADGILAQCPLYCSTPQSKPIKKRPPLPLKRLLPNVMPTVKIHGGGCAMPWVTTQPGYWPIDLLATACHPALQHLNTTPTRALPRHALTPATATTTHGVRCPLPRTRTSQPLPPSRWHLSTQPRATQAIALSLEGTLTHPLKVAANWPMPNYGTIELTSVSQPPPYYKEPLEMPTGSATNLALALAQPMVLRPTPLYRFDARRRHGVKARLAKLYSVSAMALELIHIVERVPSAQAGYTLNWQAALQELHLTPTTATAAKPTAAAASVKLFRTVADCAPHTWVVAHTKTQPARTITALLAPLVPNESSALQPSTLLPEKGSRRP